jgi:regulator of sigma E protease
VAIKDFILMDIAQLPSLLLLVFGFGFVIFWHELGHFLAAKWVGIKVEQFAVGFGQAMVAWRKGLGFTVGSSAKKYDELVQAKMNELRNQSQASDLQFKEKVGFDSTDEQAAASALGIGETEYRLNWIPLGGYVKMLGQDDLNPNAQQDDPRAYNKKSIGARMFVVSAGVIMNILLAAVGFMIVFMPKMGLRVQPPVIGSVLPSSPASHATRPDGTPAPLQVGDRVLMYDGTWQHDFTKISLNVALSGEGIVPVYVQRRDGTKERINVNPERPAIDPSGFLAIGVSPPMELRGLDADHKVDDDIAVSKEYRAVLPGEKITAVNGQPLNVQDYPKFDSILQQSNGQPVKITVVDASGKSREEEFHPQFMPLFSGEMPNFAGMLPRAKIQGVMAGSSAAHKLLPDDTILAMTFTSDGATVSNPSVAEVKSRLEKAGQTEQPVNFKVLRGTSEVDINGLVPNLRIERGKKGLGVGLLVDDQHPVIAESIEKSPAQLAGIPAGSTITAINGEPVQTWFDVKRLLAAKPHAPVKLAASTATGVKDFELKLDDAQIASVAGLYLTHPLALHAAVDTRKAKSAAEAAAWGVTETRDFVLQFYLTIHRMVQGSVSYKNMMGPVGIFNAGRQFAYKGNDWLIWFLSMISANLAVVNFLPIPIVDGGLFTFLIVEKIQGKPLSAKTQSIAQVVGLAIILSVFLLVTYQDIARMAL